VSFFASVPVTGLCDAIKDKADNALTTRICDLVANWSKIPGRPGLQQRCMASSVLANMYLRPVDDVLSAEGAGGNSAGKYGRAVRWTDDVWLFGGDRAELRRAQLRLEGCLRALGLSVNTSKTDVLEGGDLVEKVFELELGYVDIALDDPQPNAAPLEMLVAKLIREREAVSRTALRFVCTRIRALRRIDLAEQLADAVPLMPQGADHIARMLRELDLWQSKAEWFLAYAQSPWAALEWAPAQLATMFPSLGDGPTLLVDYFRSVLLSRRVSLPMLAVYSQRLAAWRPSDARDVIRVLAPKESSPLERRVLALSALQAGESRAFIRNLLSQYEDNRPTLDLLESTDYRPPRLVPDFTGR
jgi:hypothetical protein